MSNDKIKTMDLTEITSVEITGPRVIKLTFSNNKVRELDFAEMLTGHLAQLDSDEAFKKPQLTLRQELLPGLVASTSIHKFCLE